MCDVCMCCTYLLVWVYVHVSGDAHVYEYVETKGQCDASFFNLSPTLFCETSSSPEPKANRFR